MEYNTYIMPLIANKVQYKQDNGTDVVHIKIKLFNKLILTDYRCIVESCR